MWSFFFLLLILSNSYVFTFYGIVKKKKNINGNVKCYYN